MRFFKLNEAGKEIFINLAHVVKAESEKTGNILTLTMVDSSKQQVTGEEAKILKLILAQLTNSSR